MAYLKQKIGEQAARSLGKAHEKENYRSYKKRKLEDGIIPDKIASTMDLFNNEIGLTFSKKGDKQSKKELINKTINAIKDGKLRIIKKDTKGNFLTCNNVIISLKEIKGKWINNKCLVKSNYKN